MKIIADLHIHSKYSRACSKDLTPANLAVWADKKGIGILGTGDFTHPGWREELKEALVEDKPGLYKLKSGKFKARFLLTAEVASIYKEGDKVRRVHNLLFAPSFEAVDKLVEALEKRGANLKSDGRPIFGIPCRELLAICKDADENFELIPAHAWTPHFGVFGSLSGFDNLGQAFGDYSKYIFAIETGLSSDPKMNWQMEALDKISLISNSDAHSLRKLGREANVFDISENELSFKKVIEVIRNKDPKSFLYTIEFFPEEGKYHWDGHRDHNFSVDPVKARELGGICPICGKKLLRGVESRVSDLGSRRLGYMPEGAVPFKNIIPLEEVIAETFDVGTASKKVVEAYEKIVVQKTEFEVLIDLPVEELVKVAGKDIAMSVERVRSGKVHVTPGYDGVFGQIHIYTPEEREKLFSKPKQIGLF